MHFIDKTFDICYSHRIHSGYDCKNIHGHQSKLKVFLESENLYNLNISDLINLDFLKEFLDDVVDHKFIVDFKDPSLGMLLGGGYIINYSFLPYNSDQFIPIGNLYLKNTSYITSRRLILNDVKLADFQRELFESFVIVDFEPTSENLSKWIFDIVQHKMNDHNIKVRGVEWHESTKSCSTYWG